MCLLSHLWIYTSWFRIGIAWRNFLSFFLSILEKWYVYVKRNCILAFLKLISCIQKLDFKFPLSVSCIHFICSAAGAYIVIKLLKVKPLIEVNPEDRWRRIFPMSFVFCINIVLGNVSLRYIPVSFMQTIKSFTPATTGGCETSFLLAPLVAWTFSLSYDLLIP